MSGPLEVQWPDADRCEATTQHTEAQTDAIAIVRPVRCPRVWIVRVGNSKLCRSCAAEAQKGSGP